LKNWKLRAWWKHSSKYTRNNPIFYSTVEGVNELQTGRGVRERDPGISSWTLDEGIDLYAGAMAVGINPENRGRRRLAEVKAKR